MPRRMGSRSRGSGRYGSPPVETMTEVFNPFGGYISNALRGAIPKLGRYGSPPKGEIGDPAVMYDPDYLDADGPTYDPSLNDAGAAPPGPSPLLLLGLGAVALFVLLR